MTLVEKFRSDSGRVGEYKWVVEVWRSDTAALANMRVRLEVYRVRERRWFLPDSSHRVFRETNVYTSAQLEEGVEDARDKGERLAGRFDADREAAEGVSA